MNDIDSEYFAEFKTGVNNAWHVVQNTWKIVNSLTPPTAAGPVPAVPFRVAITLVTVPAQGTNQAHEDVVGEVFVNSEKISFTEATRLTNSTSLTSLPTITCLGLDCHILVECITVSGAPIYQKTLVPMEIICFPKTRIFRDPKGSGNMQTDYDIYTEEALGIGDLIRYPDPHQGKTIEIYVKNVSGAVDLEDNSQPFRVLNCA